MKIILRTAVVAALILSTSCGKETQDVIVDLFGDEAEALEITVLDIETVSDNVIIEGAVKKEGTLPEANGAISLDLENSGKTAFLDEGFELTLNSDAELTGAYIRFQSKDGNASNSYYDIDLETNDTSKKGKWQKRKNLKSRILPKFDEVLLDIDFAPSIQPGEFCYEICVYDATGNISAPQEVCLTVENWGGKSDLIAAWNLTKESGTYGSNQSTSLVGEEYCGDELSFNCSQGGEYTASYACYTTDSFEIEFKSDGTYKFDSKDSSRIIDELNSSDSCQAVYKSFNDQYISNGRWAYVSEGSRLILIEYSYTESYEGEVESQTFEPGDAEVLLDGLVEVNGNTMIISEEGTDYIDKFYFEK